MANNWLKSVVRVGGGRGFVIEVDGERLVLTAAHCLQRDGEANLPPPHGGSDLEERTYRNLLGPLGGEATVWAECLFVDPVADLAVLGSPDTQELSDEADKYDALTEATVPLAIGALAFAPERVELSAGELFVGRQRVELPAPKVLVGPPVAESAAHLLSLAGEAFACRVKSRGRALWVSDAAEPIRGGMSGSPILAPDGRAIGVVCISGGLAGQPEDHREGGPNPYLPANLPGWLVRAARQRRRRT